VLARGKVRPRKPVGGLVDASAGGLIDVSYERIIPRSLGTRIIVMDGDKPRVGTSELIHHGTKSPVSISKDNFAVFVDGQECFDIPIVEFEDEEEFDVLGNYRFLCRPNAKQGDRIQVTFHYDESGIVTADAVDLKTGTPLQGDRMKYKEPEPEAIITIKPRWVVFAIDVSYSMKGAQLRAAKDALIKNARDLFTASQMCKVGVVSFSSDARVVCDPTSDISEIEQRVNRMECESTTAMDEGIETAVLLVMGAPAGTERDVVMLTDGMPDNDRKQSTLHAASKAKSQGVTLSALSIGSGVDQDYLSRITPLTLQISSPSDIAGGMSTLLTQSEKQRSGGLVAPRTAGLVDGSK
jgi:uncharacterized protein YegL